MQAKPMEAGELQVVGQITAIYRQLDQVRVRKTWPLYGWPTRILIGSAPSCDWVFPGGGGVRKRHCLLRWDGQRLVARVIGDSGSSDQIVQPLAPLLLGAIELTMTMDPQWEEPTTPGSPIPINDEAGDTVAVADPPRGPRADARFSEPLSEAAVQPVAVGSTMSIPVGVNEAPAVEPVVAPMPELEGVPTRMAKPAQKPMARMERLRAIDPMSELLVQPVAERFVQAEPPSEMYVEPVVAPMPDAVGQEPYVAPMPEAHDSYAHVNVNEPYVAEPRSPYADVEHPRYVPAERAAYAADEPVSYAAPEHDRYAGRAHEQYASGAHEQYSNGAEEQYSNGAEEQYSNGAEEQYSNGAHQPYGTHEPYSNGANEQYAGAEQGEYASAEQGEYAGGEREYANAEREYANAEHGEYAGAEHAEYGAAPHQAYADGAYPSAEHEPYASIEHAPAVEPYASGAEHTPALVHYGKPEHVPAVDPISASIPEPTVEPPSPSPAGEPPMRRVEMLPTSVFMARVGVSADDAPTNAVRPRTPSRPIVPAMTSAPLAPQHKTPARTPSARAGSGRTPVPPPMTTPARTPQPAPMRTPSRAAVQPSPLARGFAATPSRPRVAAPRRRKKPLVTRALEAMRLLLVLPALVSPSDIQHSLATPLAAVAAHPTAAADAPPAAAAPVDPASKVIVTVTTAPAPAPRPTIDCAMAGANDRVGTATPEDHAALQLAIEAYRLGRKDEARVLFQTLTCRPEVGAPARYMLNLLSPHKMRSPVDPANTALWLPQGDRVWRLKRLFEEADREIEQHGSLWSQRDTLAHIVLANPSLRTLTYAEQPKCNIFVGELLYRAGFVSPGTPVGDKPVEFPNVNEMVAQAQRLARTGRWSANDGQQWFDVVPIEAARPGDLVLIDASHRGDIDTEHGHVEIIRTIVHRGDALVELGTVGARSAGAMESPVAGRMFGEKDKDGEFRLTRYALVARPRLR